MKDQKLATAIQKKKAKKSAETKIEEQKKHFDRALDKNDKKVSDVNRDADRKIKAAKKRAAEATSKAERIANEAE